MLADFESDKVKFLRLYRLYAENIEKFTDDEVRELHDVFEMGRELYELPRLLVSANEYIQARAERDDPRPGKEFQNDVRAKIESFIYPTMPVNAWGNTMDFDGYYTTQSDPNGSKFFIKVPKEKPYTIVKKGKYTFLVEKAGKSPTYYKATEATSGSLVVTGKENMEELSNELDEFINGTHRYLVKNNETFDQAINREITRVTKHNRDIAKSDPFTFKEQIEYYTLKAMAEKDIAGKARKNIESNEKRRSDADVIKRTAGRLEKQIKDYYKDQYMASESQQEAMPEGAWGRNTYFDGFFTTRTIDGFNVRIPLDLKIKAFFQADNHDFFLTKSKTGTFDAFEVFSGISLGKDDLSNTIEEAIEHYISKINSIKTRSNGQTSLNQMIDDFLTKAKQKNIRIAKPKYIVKDPFEEKAIRKSIDEDKRKYCAHFQYGSGIALSEREREDLDANIQWNRARLGLLPYKIPCKEDDIPKTVKSLLNDQQITLSGYDDDKTRFEAILDLYISNASKFTASEINELNEVFELGKELFGSERELPVFEEKTDIPVLTEEDYLAINGASRQDFGDSALHKNKGNNSDKQWSKLVDAQAEKDRKLMEKRQELREEFQEKVENGELREPTRLERLVSTANAPYDTEARRAARAVLAKNGMQSKVLNPDQNEPIPDNIESENEDEITENYFIVNSERKLEVYFNYDKYKNLPEADKKFIKSNFLWSRGKGAWISKASHPSQVQYLSNRLANELKLRSKGREKRMTFQEERDKERSKAEYKVQVYDRRAQSAEARGEALQSEFDKLRQDWSWLTQPVIRGHRGSESFGKQRQRIIDRYSKGFQEFDKAKYYKAAKEYQENSLQNPELKNIDYIRKKIKEIEKLIKTYTGYLEVAQIKLKVPNRPDLAEIEDRMQRYMEELEYNYEKLAYYKLAEEALIENNPTLKEEDERKASKKAIQKDEVLIVKSELKKYFKKIDPNITVSHSGVSIIAQIPLKELINSKNKEDSLESTRNSIRELFGRDASDGVNAILLSAKQWKLWMTAEGIIWDKTLSQNGAIKMARELKEAGKINTLSGLEESTPTYPTIPQSVADEIGQAFTRAGQMDFVRLMKNPAVANTVIQLLKQHGIINSGNQSAWMIDSTTLTDNGITILRESLWKTIFPNLGTSDFPVQVSDKVLKNLSSFLKIRQNLRIFQQFEIAVQIGNEFAGNDDTVMFDDPLDAQEFAFLCPFLYDTKNDKFEWVLKKYLDWNGKTDRKQFLESLSGEIGHKKQRQSTFGLSDQYVWR